MLQERHDQVLLGGSRPQEQSLRIPEGTPNPATLHNPSVVLKLVGGHQAQLTLEAHVTSTWLSWGCHSKDGVGFVARAPGKSCVPSESHRRVKATLSRTALVQRGTMDPHCLVPNYSLGTIFTKGHIQNREGAPGRRGPSLDQLSSFWALHLIS